MNTTQVLEVFIPMLVMLAAFVGLALRLQANLRRTLDESIEKFSNQVGKDREKDRKELKDFRTEVTDFRTEVRNNREKDLTEARANREEDRRELQAFRTEVLDRFETTNRKIDANAATIDVNAAETNGNIALNTTKIDANAAETNAKIDAIAAAAAGDRERFETFRGDTREDFKELGDKIDTNAATHDRNITEVGDQVAGFKERVSRVEGYIEATSSRPRSVTTGR